MLKFLKGLFITSITIIVVVIVGWWYLQPNKPSASQLWYNGIIITMDSTQPNAEAVLIAKDKIVAVGDSATLLAQAPAGTVKHDLAKATMIPGFVDAHSHFPGSGMSLFAADLRSPPVGPITNIQQLLDALALQASKTKSDQWIVGFGYDQLMLAEKRHPTIEELDKISPDRPIFIMHVSGHLGVANSAALNEISQQRSEAWSSKTLQTGILEENDAVPFQRKMFNLGVADFLAMIDYAEAEYAAAGVTTLQSSNVDQRYLQGIKLGKWLGKIPQRIVVLPTYETLGLELIEGKTTIAALESNDVHISAIKLIADGSIQGFTGYLSHAYHTPHEGDSTYLGYPRIVKQELQENVLNIANAGLQIAVHGNGDASIDDILDAFEYAAEHATKPLQRPIIIHAQMARQDQLERMAKLNVIPSFYVSHTYYWGDQHYNTTIGPERAMRISPTKSAQNLGLVFTNHLDTPVVPMSPMLAWWSSVERKTYSGKVLGENEKIDVLSGLKALTLDAAYQVFMEDTLGSIRQGKQADFVILAENPLTTSTPIKDIAIEETIFGGVSIYKK